MLDTELTPRQLHVRQYNSKLIGWITFNDDSVFRGYACKIFTDFEAEAWIAAKEEYGDCAIKSIAFQQAKPQGILTAEQSLFKIHIHTLTVMLGDNTKLCIYGLQLALKALCFKQPWADLILAGLKTIETRKWRTEYRGRILICTSKEVDAHVYPRKSTFMEKVGERLKSIGIVPWQTGKAVGLTNIAEITEMRHYHEAAAYCKVYPRANAWFIENIRLIKPVPIKGSLSLFTPELNYQLELL